MRRLRGAWVNRIEGGRSDGNSQSTAVAVDGVVYIESALGNVVAEFNGSVILGVFNTDRAEATRSLEKLAATLGSESRAQLGYLIGQSGILGQERQDD